MEVPVSSVFAAKFTLLILFAHGVVHLLAPDETAKRYRTEATDEQYTRISTHVRRIGCCILFSAAIGWALIFQDFSKGSAYALATTIWIVEYLGATLNREGKRRSYSEAANVVSLVLCCLLVPGFLVESERSLWHQLSVAMGTFMWAFYAVMYGFFPRFLTVSIWKIDPEHYEEDKFIFPMTAVVCIHCLTLVCTLEFLDMTPVRALGFAQASLAIGLLYPFVLNSEELSIGNLKQRHLVMCLGTIISTLSILLGSLQEGEDDTEIQEEANVSEPEPVIWVVDE